MKTLLIILFTIFLAVVVYLWVKGISSMDKNYPDYDGEDWFDDDDDEYDYDEEE